MFALDRRLLEAAGDLRRAMLLANLHALDSGLRAAGGRLHVTSGPPEEVLLRFGDDLTVHMNADYTPHSVARDRRVADVLGERLVVHHGGVVHRPGAVVKDDGSPYRVFTPFHRRWLAASWRPWASPVGDVRVADDAGEALPPLTARPPITAGETGAWQRLEMFLERVDAYDDDRDRPDLPGVSELSVDLKFGTLDPRRLREEIGEETPGRQAFVRQLCWRDFYASLLFERPDSVVREWSETHRSMTWRTDERAFAAWADGSTGFPIVDAGMRQLRAVGYMHNRIRMLAASFLVKDLQIDWRLGERHFRRLLIDADVASNVGNWQWVAGTGADAAPYFRVFNPVTQGRRFDPDGDYVRRWVPELAKVPGRWIHAPWEAPPLELAVSGVTLGETYPYPLVDHAEARAAALEAFGRAREG